MSCETWVHFNVDLLNAFVSRAGQPAVWEQAYRCPCRSTRTGGADPSCPVCDGRGYRWDAPTTVQIGVSSLNATRQFDLPTEWVEGDVMLTIPSDSTAAKAGEFDRFALTSSTYRYSSVMTRGTNDRLPYTNIACVDKLWSIQGGVPVTLRQDQDYRLNGSTIVWISQAVPVGSQYAVQYQAHPEYFVFRDLVQDRRAFGDALPRKVHARLMSLFGRLNGVS